MLVLPLTAKPFSKIVDDQTDLFLTVPDLGGLRRSWLAHPLADALGGYARSGRFGSWLDQRTKDSGPSLERMTQVLREEFNLTWEEFFELFPGQFSISLHNLGELLLGQATQPDLVIMAEFSRSKETLHALMQIQFERNAAAQRAVNPLIEHELVEESFMGETIYIDEVFDGSQSYVEDGFTFVDGVFILAVKPERLRALVESVKLGTERPLAEARAYLRNREAAAAGAVTFFANAEAWLPALNEALQNPKVTAPVAMLGVSGRSLGSALALDELLGFGFDLNLTERGMESSSGLVYQSKAGLLRLFTFGSGGLPEAKLVPERAVAASVSNYDLSRMFAELQRLLTAASPATGLLLDRQLQQIRTQSGIDLRAAVLENFGSELVSFSVLPEQGPSGSQAAEPEQVFLLGVKDTASLANAVEALKDRVPGMREVFEPVPFKGEVIYEMDEQSLGGAGNLALARFSYAITRSHLLIHQGPGKVLQEVISAMQEGTGGLWQSPAIVEAFEPIARPNAVSRSTLGLDTFLGTILASLAEPGDGPLAGLPNAGAGPAVPSLPYRLISETNEAADGLFTRSRLIEVEARR